MSEPRYTVEIFDGFVRDRIFVHSLKELSEGIAQYFLDLGRDWVWGEYKVTITDHEKE